MAEHEFPPYSYVPGGPWPHPRSDPRGHSYFIIEKPALPPAPEQWCKSTEYIRGCDLFNHGYYWEAHEAWEAVWHAAGRKGLVADFVKGLIKLAAAGVKIRERVTMGVVRHALAAGSLFRKTEDTVGKSFMGQNLAGLIQIADDLAKSQTVFLPEVETCPVRVVINLKLNTTIESGER